MVKQAKTAKERNAKQLQRFREAAKELGADESGETFERAFKKIVPPKNAKVENKRHQ
jgi:hypothetical protein